MWELVWSQHDNSWGPGAECGLVLLPMLYDSSIIKNLASAQLQFYAWVGMLPCPFPENIWNQPNEKCNAFLIWLKSFLEDVGVCLSDPKAFSLLSLVSRCPLSDSFCLKESEEEFLFCYQRFGSSYVAVGCFFFFLWGVGCASQSAPQTS